MNRHSFSARSPPGDGRARGGYSEAILKQPERKLLVVNKGYRTATPPQLETVIKRRSDSCTGEFIDKLLDNPCFCWYFQTEESSSMPARTLGKLLQTRRGYKVPRDYAPEVNEDYDSYSICSLRGSPY